MEKPHLYYIDYLRVVLTVLVILHHSSITYGGQGSWYYIESSGNEFTPTVGLLSLFTGVNQAYFMGFFFLISGYFTPESYDRKGPATFLKERFLRLGIPIVVYVFLIGPLLIYFLEASRIESFWSFYLSQVLTFHFIEWGPLWFVESLLYMAIVYVLFRKWSNSKGVKTASQQLRFPSNRVILLSALLIGCVSFFIRLIFPVGQDVLGLQLGYFPSYIFLFIIGIIAFRQGWFQSLSVRRARLWLKLSLCIIPILPITVVSSDILGKSDATVNGGPSLLALIYSFWEPFVAFGIIMYLLVWFREYFNKSNPWLKRLSNAAYTVYIIHPPIVVASSYLIRDAAFPDILKFIIVGLMATVCCFVISALIRKIPYFDRVL